MRSDPAPNPSTGLRPGLKPVIVVLTDSLVARLDAFAERRVESRSHAIRQACEEFLARHGQSANREDGR